ncbi:unnamed protein product [Spodoptera littoralis]|uniref:Cathepsin propeptide inhibitor domain-containing protein n=1 Tax=Spodoptera littoralis TaxID=7109 RepID=A0A9P0IEQ5_SPOLI|nr:unnamed protein product [Spodoptera littoralis]CAH1645461.1 unnamed protein product [Spodoptera littoralis]
MLFLIITAFINIIFLIKFVGTEEDTTALFERFKIHFHRVYNSPESEEEAYNNFVKNLQIANDLNKKHPGDVIAYQLNRYADIDPDTIEDRYALDIVPYDHIVKEGPRQQLPHKLIKDIKLYDLNDVDELYDKYLRKWKKTNLTKSSDRMAHYYRFVKTVVEVNKQRFAGEDVTLGPNADVLKEPNEYFYG